MLKSYIKIARRFMLKNRLYTGVNIIGLAVGLTFSFLISSHIWSEFMVNRHLKHFERQYIVQSHWKKSDMGIDFTTLGPLAKALKEHYPQLVANYYRFDGIGSIISRGYNSFQESIALGDSTLFEMYGFKLLKGNTATALKRPFSVVLTPDMARKYFGGTDVIGKTLLISSFSGAKHPFIITGLFEKPGRNTVTRLNEINDNQVFVSSSNLGFFSRNMDWNNPDIVSFVELQPGVKPGDLDEPIKSLIRSNTPQQTSANLQPYLTPLASYYLESNGAAIKKSITALGLIAAFILCMAVINFVNISVGQSASRLKEVSVRKILGAERNELLMQFLAESVLMVCFSTVLAVASFLMLRAWFGSLFNEELPGLGELPSSFLLIPLAIIVLLGLVSGMYPSFVLASVNSVGALKGRLHSNEGHGWLRNILIIIQFSVASVVLVCAIVITNQIQLFFKSDLGYSKEYVVSAAVPRDWSRKGWNKMELVRKQIASLSEVNDCSLSYSIPDGGGAGSSSFYKAGTDSTNFVSAETVMSDEHYASIYRVKMRAGVFFGLPGTITDSTKIVINESEAKLFGWKQPQTAIGQRLKTWADPRTYTVAGVIRDFNFGAFSLAIKPMTFLHLSSFPVYRFICMKLRPGDMQRSIRAIHEVWSRLLPGAPFEYVFQDQTLSSLYTSELQLQKAAYLAAFVALFIVLLGVLGLVSLSISRRTREIGIRKVLGVSVPGIIGLFLKEIIPVTLVGALISFPIAWFIIRNWLENYAYRVSITSGPFIGSILCLVIATSMLIFVQTFKTALENPVKSLKAE